MNVECRTGGAIAVLMAAVLVAGCGGSNSSSQTTAASSPTTAPSNQATTAAKTVMKAPTAKVVIACFKKKGARSVYQKKEYGVTIVNGLVSTTGTVGAGLTDDQGKSERLIKTLEGENLPTLRFFEAREGAAVGIYSPERPPSKRVVHECLE